MKTKKQYVGSYGVILEDNKIVLIKKGRGGYKGKLDLPGGGIEDNENPVAALKREIDEEVGTIVTDYQLIDAVANKFTWLMEENIFEELHHIGIIYLAKIQGNIKREADGHDSLGSEWYKIDELEKENLTPFAIMALEKLGYKLK